ncbi:hypothetical protein HMPREF9374_3747 [Desmospora sp. 8437]|nr:hypothetical protein HMPREF9374_3747 [Desmospora sp. 8437]
MVIRDLNTFDPLFTFSSYLLHFTLIQESVYMENRGKSSSPDSNEAPGSAVSR